MDFTLSQEQQMLQETSRRFLQDHAGFDEHRRQQHQPQLPSSALWQGLAELGLLAINTPSEFDGLGLGPIETMLVMQTVGEHLLLAPFCASAVVATCLLDAAGTPEQRAAYSPALAMGDCIAVLAHDEQGSGQDRLAIASSAQPEGGQFRLQGHKSVVAHALSADLLLITAKLQDALRLFAVPAALLQERLVPCPLVDGTLAADLLLDELMLPANTLLGKEDASLAVASALDRGLAAICAEAVGALDKLLAACVDYVRNRKQFDVAIGSFQALRHRLADMLMHVEQARSMCYLAAVRCTDPDLAARAQALSAAKVVIGQACRFVGQQAVQLHGGMGVTDELIVSHYFKRLMAIELQFGSTDHHLQAFASQLRAKVA